MKLIILNTSDNPDPEYKTSGAAGMDLAASEVCRIGSREGTQIKTGIHVAIPEGFEGQVRIRSSLGNKGLILSNAPGTIDSDYRGEIRLLAYNLNDHIFGIEKGERIAQLVITPIVTPQCESVSEDEFKQLTTDRGSGGFGSTGS